MSVSIIINNPETEHERLLSIPVSSEDFFKKVWLQVAMELDLKWVPLFQTGVEIEKCDLDVLFKELDSMSCFVKENLKNEDGAHLLIRVSLIKRRVLEMFDRKGLSIYIG